MRGEQFLRESMIFGFRQDNDVIKNSITLRSTNAFCFNPPVNKALHGLPSRWWVCCASVHEAFSKNARSVGKHFQGNQLFVSAIKTSSVSIQRRTVSTRRWNTVTHENFSLQQIAPLDRNKYFWRQRRFTKRPQLSVTHANCAGACSARKLFYL